jgi:N6-adenosine-specific RNA methylase IME4/DNA-binding XRE family transcriptional regulator
LALKLKPLVAAQAKENLIKGAEMTNTGLQKSVKAVNTQKEIAKAAGVSHDTIAKVEKIQAKATPEIKKAVKSGEMSINQAYNAIKNEERKEAIQKQIEDIEHEVMVKPDGLFDVIAIDPPWNYGTQFSASGRRVANPYPEMTQEQLKAIEIPASDNCVMFLWTTHKFIWDAKELLDTWGFEYRSMLVWDKQKIGMGDLLRMQCEFCLIGIKGKPVFRDNHSIRDIIAEPRREHSRKPDGFYQLVNDLCVGRKLDYFSRETREGWVSYGNDTDKFN